MMRRVASKAVAARSASAVPRAAARGASAARVDVTAAAGARPAASAASAAASTAAASRAASTAARTVRHARRAVSPRNGSEADAVRDELRHQNIVGTLQKLRRGLDKLRQAPQDWVKLNELSAEIDRLAAKGESIAPALKELKTEVAAMAERSSVSDAKMDALTQAMHGDTATMRATLASEFEQMHSRLAAVEEHVGLKQLKEFNDLKKMISDAVAELKAAKEPEVDPKETALHRLFVRLFESAPINPTDSNRVKAHKLFSESLFQGAKFAAKSAILWAIAKDLLYTDQALSAARQIGVRGMDALGLDAQIATSIEQAAKKLIQKGQILDGGLGKRGINDTIVSVIESMKKLDGQIERKKAVIQEKEAAIQALKSLPLYGFVFEDTRCFMMSYVNAAKIADLERDKSKLEDQVTQHKGAWHDHKREIEKYERDTIPHYDELEVALGQLEDAWLAVPDDLKSKYSQLVFRSSGQPSDAVESDFARPGGTKMDRVIQDYKELIAESKDPENSLAIQYARAKLAEQGGHCESHDEDNPCRHRTMLDEWLEHSNAPGLEENVATVSKA